MGAVGILVLGTAVATSLFYFSVIRADDAAHSRDASQCRAGSLEACKSVLLLYRTTAQDKEAARSALKSAGVSGFADPFRDTP